MVRTIIFFFVFWGYLICCIPHLLLAMLFDRVGLANWSRRLVARQSSHWGRFMLTMSGSTVLVEGREKIPATGGLVIVANHQGALDIPLTLGFLSRPIAFIAKMELHKVPLMGSWMKCMGCQFLDRDDRRQGLDVFRNSVDYLLKGGVMLVFPEGTRSRGGPLAEFKKGSLRMAISAGVPVIPVTIVDSYRIREANNGWIHPSTVRLIISDPIITTSLTREEQTLLVERTRTIIEENLKTYSRGITPTGTVITADSNPGVPSAECR